MQNRSHRGSSTKDSGLRTKDSPQSSLQYLDSLQASGIRPGLARMRALLRAAGRPERAYPSIIVAGTNGKGSTSATLASILNASGYRTAHYTSPHLVDIRERWTIAGAPIDDATLVESVSQLRTAAKSSGITPTYFEALTIVAFLAFAIAQCDVAVLEVGMGGRLDATNVVRPLAALITPIGLDHTEYLGNTIVRIAHEKAGVIHRGTIALTTNRNPRILAVLQRRAARFGAELIVVDGEHDTPLHGAYQRQNAALAVRAAEALMPQLPRITRATIERGVAETRWRGRLERMRVAGKDVWIDGGHNAHAARAVAEFIASDVAAPRTLVFGIMRDKDVREVVEILFPLFDDVIVTEPYPPRSMTVEELAVIAPRVVPERLPAGAIERALRGGSRSVFIAGSLYLAGAAIEHLDQRRDDD
jgi:dihydrofolate synthase/folylpolyglutamate synthase